MYSMQTKEVKGKINIDNKLDLSYDSINLKVVFKLEKRQVEYIRPVVELINKDFYVLQNIGSVFANFEFNSRIPNLDFGSLYSGRINVNKEHQFSISISENNDYAKKSPNLPKIEIILKHFLDDRSNLNMELHQSSLTLRASIVNKEFFRGLEEHNRIRHRGGRELEYQRVHVLHVALPRG